MSSTLFSNMCRVRICCLGQVHKHTCIDNEQAAAVRTRAQMSWIALSCSPYAKQKNQQTKPLSVLTGGIMAQA